jgi:hypothetical protein
MRGEPGIKSKIARRNACAGGSFALCPPVLDRPARARVSSPQLLGDKYFVTGQLHE